MHLIKKSVRANFGFNVVVFFKKIFLLLLLSVVLLCQPGADGFSRNDCPASNKPFT